MQINLIADTSVASAPSGFTAAVQAAATVLDRDLPGNYTVNITYGWGTYDNTVSSDLQPSSRAFSEGGVAYAEYNDYDTVRSRLVDTATTPYQILAAASLPSTSPSPYGIVLGPAQEKALGLFTGDSSAVDGSIGFNTADASGGSLSRFTEEAALVELAHALGLFSGYRTATDVYLLDLDRYVAPGQTYSDGNLPSYFSVDGGALNLANYSNTDSSGVTDHTLFENVRNDPFNLPPSTIDQHALTTLDLAAMNALGFAGTTTLFGTDVSDPGSTAGEVYALYQTVLGRAADTAGLSYYTGLVDDGTSLTTVAQSMLSSGEYAARSGASTGSNDGFIDQVYADGLHRQAEAGGRQTYDAALASGTSRAQVAVDIATSDESQSDLAPAFAAGVFIPSETDAAIARLYPSLLDRAPDAVGLAHYEVYGISAGTTLLDDASAFLASAEYAQLHGTQSNGQFLTSLYEGALGRDPDASGQANYLGELGNGVSRAQVAVEVSQSPEAKAHLAPLLQNTAMFI